MEPKQIINDTLYQFLSNLTTTCIVFHKDLETNDKIKNECFVLFIIHVTYVGLRISVN